MGQAKAPEGVNFSFPRYETQEDLKVMENLLEIAEIRKKIAGLDLETAMLDSQTKILYENPYSYVADLSPLIAERTLELSANEKQKPIEIEANTQTEEPSVIPENVRTQEDVQSEAVDVSSDENKPTQTH